MTALQAKFERARKPRPSEWIIVPAGFRNGKVTFTLVHIVRGEK